MHTHINTCVHTCTHGHTHTATHRRHVKDSRVGWSRLCVWLAGCVSWSDANILSHCSLSAHLACSALLLWSDWSRTDCAPRRAGRLCKCAWSSSHIRRLPVVWSFFQPVRCLATFVPLHSLVRISPTSKFPNTCSRGKTCATPAHKTLANMHE